MHVRALTASARAREVACAYSSSSGTPEVDLRPPSLGRSGVVGSALCNRPVTLVDHALLW